MRLVVRSGEDWVFSDGPALAEAARVVREALDLPDLESWPYVGFVAEDEAA